MRNGNIVDYLQTPAGKRCEKVALVHQMALGMEYLHSRDIIHGDFKVSPAVAGGLELTDHSGDQRTRQRRGQHQYLRFRSFPIEARLETQVKREPCW